MPHWTDCVDKGDLELVRKVAETIIDGPERASDKDIRLASLLLLDLADELEVYREGNLVLDGKDISEIIDKLINNFGMDSILYHLHKHVCNANRQYSQPYLTLLISDLETTMGNYQNRNYNQS